MTDAQTPPPASSKKKVMSIVSALFVIVLIVGCLGAIATPKFGAFQCKSKQSEAKTNLSGLFTAERAFAGEYGFHTTDLVALQWTPDGTPLYAYGFVIPSEPRSAPGLADHDPTRKSTIDPRVVAAGHYGTNRMNALDGRAFTEADLAEGAPAATATSSGFLIVAVGDIDTDSGVKLDVWTIDEERHLAVVSNDCTN